MEEFLNKYFSKDLRELKGLKIEGAIPLSDKVLNEVIQEQVQGLGQESAPVDLNYSYYRFLKWTKWKAVTESTGMVLEVDLLVEE